MANRIYSEIILDPSKISTNSDESSLKYLNDFKKYIDSKNCYSSNPLNHAEIDNIQSKVAYQCKINILMEERDIIWSQKPTKQRLNRSIKPIFNLWTDYQFQLPISSDKRSEQKRSLPEHDYTTNCDVCQGQRSIKCTNHRCNYGTENCLLCTHGRKSDGTQCTRCKNGLIECKICRRKGRLECINCNGCGAFHHSAILYVWWEIRTSIWYYQNSFLPEEKIAQANKISLWSRSETPWTKQSSINNFLSSLDEQNSTIPLKANIIRDYQEKHLNDTIKMKNQMRRLICEIERLDFYEIEYSLQRFVYKSYDQLFWTF